MPQLKIQKMSFVIIYYQYLQSNHDSNYMQFMTAFTVLVQCTAADLFHKYV